MNREKDLKVCLFENYILQRKYPKQKSQDRYILMYIKERYE